MLTIPQLARTWWKTTGSAGAAARRRLETLQQDGLIALLPLTAHPELPLSAPVIAWKPGTQTPNLGAASYQLKHRWSSSPRPVPAIIATTTAARLFGGHGGRWPRESEQTHDIHLSTVYLHYRKTRPALASSWVSEAQIYDAREDKDQKLPDAMITVDGNPHVIEFGGAYSRAKLEAFHGYCEALELPYEVW